MFAMFALAAPFGAALPTQQKPPLQEKPAAFKMMTYQAVLVLQGPKWSPVQTPAAQTHDNYVAQLVRSGRAVIGGPFVGHSKYRGLYILTGTPEGAKTIANADPGVKDKRYKVEILKWMGPEGWFARTKESKTEKLYFGFLVNGPNRTQNQATAQALQKEHLSYMDRQAEIGKLVMAGPIIEGGTRRGAVAYRVPTMKEARERANGDPMIKVGRLVAELYEWQVPQGILK